MIFNNKKIKGICEDMCLTRECVKFNQFNQNIKSFYGRYRQTFSFKPKFNHACCSDSFTNKSFIILFNNKEQRELF
jgi:hypothetical protein